MKQVCRSLLFLLPLICILSHVGHAEIFYNLENPSVSQTVSGIGIISGWAFSTTPDAKVTVNVIIDGGEPFAIPCCVNRKDVFDNNSSFPQALNSGFGQVYNFNLLSQDSSHKINLQITDGQDSVTSPEQNFATVKPGGFEVLSLLDILFASNVQIENKDNIDDQEISMENVRAVQKDPSTSQTVKIRLAWQTNSQSLGIVSSENTGSATSSQVSQANQSASGQGQVAQTGQVQSADTTPAITVTLENPPAPNTASVAQAVSGIGLVSGWAVSATSGATISSVQQRVDGGVTGNVPCCSNRADVAAAYPDRPEALNSGFGASYNFNLLPTGSHTIGVEVKDSTSPDASVVVDNAVTVVKLGNSEFIDQFDLSNATVNVDGEVLVVDNVSVRDKASQDSTSIFARFAWQPSCQCFVAQAICGNGSVEPTEECDSKALDDETCSTLGYGGGSLSCDAFCEFDVSQCTRAPRLYVTNLLESKAGTVSVINTATNRLEGDAIKVGKEPRGIVVSPNGALAYVTNFRDDTVSVINTATNTVTTTFKLQQDKGKKGPQGVAISPDGTRLYTVNGFDNTVSVIDTSTNSVLANVAVGKEPQRIAITPDGKRAYVTSFATNSVSVLDLTANPITTIGKPIPVGENPDGITVSPDGKWVYVANSNFVNHTVGEDSVSIIDTATNTTRGEPLLVGFDPVRIVFSPDGTRAYVACYGNGTISVINTTAASDTAPAFVVGEIATQDLPEGLVPLLRGKRLYVALFGRDGSGADVEVSSTVTGASVGGTSAGDGPFEVAIVPAKP